jgi:hypothetical protein
MLRAFRRLLGITSPSREFASAAQHPIAFSHPGLEAAVRTAAACENARQQVRVLVASGAWEPCKHMKRWDSMFAIIPEPDRWALFECAEHEGHQWLWVGPEERAYLGSVPA